VFPLERSEEVCSVMKVLMNDASYGTSGLILVTAPPPARQPCLVISARLLGKPSNASEAFKSLFDLQPLVANGTEVPIQNTSDSREELGAKGGFKRLRVAGLHHFDPDAFMKAISLWKEMVAECPDAINTALNFQWDSRPVKTPRLDSAMSHHDIRYWQYVHNYITNIHPQVPCGSTKLTLRDFYRLNLIWHTDLRNRRKVDKFNERSIAIMRSSQNEADWIDYQNGTRTGPIHYRYRGMERLARLRKLKKAWDPTGVFTTQLLL